MINRLLTWLRGSASYLWLVVLAAYLSVSAGQAVLRNYQSQQDTKQLTEQLSQLENKKAELEALVVYYNTDAYKEKELRRTLLLKKPGERVYALPESSLGKKQEEQSQAEALKNDPRRSLPIWQQWVDYLLNGKQA